MEQQRMNRGRGRPSANRRNFFDEEVEREEISKKREIAEKKKVKKETPVEISPAKKEEKHALVEAGKAWISKYYRGQTKKTRGNIEVRLRHDIDLQIYSLYERRLFAWITNIKTTPETMSACQNMLRPLINLLMGIKLLHANTTNSKAEMIEYHAIERLEIDAPKRMAAIVNNLGKSDANYDNVIRIKSQGLMAKVRFFIAIIDYYGRNEDLWNNNLSGIGTFNYTALHNFREKHLRSNEELKFYDLSIDGAKYVNQQGKEVIEWLNDYEFPIEESGNVKFYVRLPKFDSSKGNNFNYILEWSEKAWQLTKGLNIPDDVFGKVAYAAWIGYMPLRWLENRKKEFQTVEPRLKKTIYEGLVIEDALLIWHLKCMDDFMDDGHLTRNTLILVREYREVVAPFYDQIFDMTKFAPTDYGSPAQIVEGHKMQLRYNKSQEMDENEIVDETTTVHSKVRISESEALIGSMINLTSRVEYVSEYNIAYEGKISEISTDFMLADFKIRSL